MKLHPFDEVIYDGRKALIVFFWPDGVLARIRFSDTGQRRSVMVSDLERAPLEETSHAEKNEAA